MHVTRYRYVNRMKLIAQGIVLLGVLSVAVVGALQLDQVREFFSKASGEPANIIVAADRVLGPMPRPWRNLAQGGEDHAWRIGGLIPQVKALRPTYIRIDHIYDFYDIVGGTPGNLTFNFSKLDLVIDDILAVGAKPYIALSYMPPVIASGDIVSPPKSYSDWQLVIQKTIEHISGTRGITNVYYEVWNEPDLFGDWKYYGDRNYITLYDYAAKGAQNARGVQAFKFGGPGITALYKNWFIALADHATKTGTRLDFFSWHRYNHDIDQYKKDMTDARTWLSDYPSLAGTLELHITEWGHDSENDPGYDTNYGAAHAVAGAIEMVGIVERAFVFEIQDGKDPNGQAKWGRWGLFTHNDHGAVAKPRYNGLRLLDKIGTQRVQLLGKGSWVKGLAAKNDDGQIQIVLSNFDKSGSHSENVPITISGMPTGSYTITKEFHTGAVQSGTVAISESQIKTTVSLAPNTVVLITFKKM